MTNAFTPIEILRPTILEFGNGTINAAARFAERIGAKRPLVVSDPFNARRVEMRSMWPGVASAILLAMSPTNAQDGSPSK
ncbi:hypothetical protein [Bradyrhizobium sp. LB11.1]|uniref:hypothetical protein n=1 Tax=Bradyrhizobium sp. LB11.1 TaxID=3156326 RepID=UPI00339AC784